MPDPPSTHQPTSEVGYIQRPEEVNKDVNMWKMPMESWSSKLKYGGLLETIRQSFLGLSTEQLAIATVHNLNHELINPVRSNHFFVLSIMKLDLSFFR